MRAAIGIPVIPPKTRSVRIGLPRLTAIAVLPP